ncbi:MAG: flavodoxin domain-containing protein [Desulfobacteraceae bacterium]
MHNPLEIAENIFSVGCRDWDIRDFHGYSTYEGTTYNAYLVKDEKNVLIDTVKEEFADELMDNISRIMDPSEIDILISNHTEMDHSGSIPRVLHRIGEDTPVYCSKMGQKNLKSHFNRDYNYKVVQSGDELNIGKRTFSFLETKMLHWPDSMFSFLKDEGILFSSDAFGQHIASGATYDDEIGNEVITHARKYYANILLAYSGRVQKLLQTVTDAGLEFKMICPDHGIIWRDNPSAIISAYDRWSRQMPSEKVVILFDTMWKSTSKMARAVARGVEDENVDVRLMNTRKWHRSDIMTEILDAGGIAVGSPTLNNGIFPVVADVLTYIRGLRPENKVAAAFGSYGWSGEAVRILNKELEGMKLDIIDQGLSVQYVPDENDIEKCITLGRKIGKKVAEICK